MIKKMLFFWIFFTLIFLSLGIVSSASKYYSHNIQKSYTAGETIKGKVNLSFSNEPIDSLFKTNFEGSIALLELLKANNFTEGEEFNCTTIGCVPGYEAGNALTETELNGKKILGLKLQGNNIEEITSIRFNVEGTLPASCTAPLLINFLNDNKTILSSTKYNDKACSSKSYGCFEQNISTYSSAVIEDFEICESITLSPAPAYRIGAKVINSTKGNSTLEMTLKNENGNDFSCILPPHKQLEEEIDCIIKFSSSIKTNLTVCIKNKGYTGPDGSNYKIRTETNSPVCGSLNRDFEIYSFPLEYAQTIITFNTSVFEELYGSSLETLAHDYLSTHYKLNEDGSIKCAPCILPIIAEGPQQTLKFSNINLVFRDGGLTTDDAAYKQIYALSTTPVKISSASLKIDLEPAKFIIPYGTKENKLSLYLNDNLLFRENISITESFNFDITPKFAFLGLETKFEVVTPFNITSSTWNFGDGSTEKSESKTIYHRYKEAKTFNIEVKLVRKDGTTAIKKFDIVVGNAKESADLTIKEYTERISNLTKKINSYPSWISGLIQSSINITKLNSSLSSIKIEFLNATSDEDYSKIMNKLLSLNVPSEIFSTKKGKLSLAVGFKNIDERYVKEISGEGAPESSELQEYIIGWFNENYKADVQFEFLSAISDEKKEALLTYFTLTISPLEDKKENAYLFIDHPLESIIFKQNYAQKPIREGAGVYLPIKPESQTIEFSIQDEIEVAELGAYISPEIEKLGISEENEEVCLPDDEECKVQFPWTRLLLWLGIAFVVILIIYIILQEWYKKHYEHHLFKSPNDLYNLINFIYNSRVSGLEDREIRKKLKEAGWSSERITYTFNKINGRRTGMWEIPLFKSIENKRVRTEIEKRQQNPLDIRFIKQPRF